LARRGRLGLTGPDKLLLEELTAPVIVLPLSMEIALAAAAFPSGAYPKDPADRLIGATAAVTGAALITKDEAIRGSGLVRTVW